MRQFVEFQHELKVNYGKLVAVSADPPLVEAAFRAGLGAQWTFLSDEQRTIIKQINILDETEGEYAFARSPTPLCCGQTCASTQSITGGILSVAPPMRNCDTTCVPSCKTVLITATKGMTRRKCGRFCIPQQEWTDGAPPLGANGLPVAQGVVRWFDLNGGIGMIAREGSGEDVFFHFTAIPGQGYRSIRPGIPVQFEVVETRTGPTARNIQQIKEPTL